MDSRSGRCPDNPPGALPLDPAKGLRPSRHPGGCPVMGRFSCRGHGARRARRDAGSAACRCGGEEGSAPTGAGRGLCGRPLHSFAASLPVVTGGCLSRYQVNYILLPLHPKGQRRFPKGDRKALWSPPQRRNSTRWGNYPTPENPSMRHAEYGGALAPLPCSACRPREA